MAKELGAVSVAMVSHHAQLKHKKAGMAMQRIMG